MGFYVKNKGMPENCMMCGFYRAGIGCVITRTLFNPLTNVATRQSNCPLIEIPPHGRLIDADALIADLKQQCKAVWRTDAASPDDYWITRNEAYNEALWKTWVESFFDYLQTRPTIIPAKGGE